MIPPPKLFVSWDPPTRLQLHDCSSLRAVQVLKKLLNEERPNEAHGKSDPGMPSSHANSESKLTTHTSAPIPSLASPSRHVPSS